MTKYHFLIMILGLLLFFLGPSYGFGWLVGWIFIGLLRQFRQPILDWILAEDRFKVSIYVLYLVLIVVWLAIPFVFAYFYWDHINPFAIFAAYFADRILMFVLGLSEKRKSDVSN